MCPRKIASLFRQSQNIILDSVLLFLALIAVNNPLDVVKVRSRTVHRIQAKPCSSVGGKTHTHTTQHSSHKTDPFDSYCFFCPPSSKNNRLVFKSKWLFQAKSPSTRELYRLCLSLLVRKVCWHFGKESRPDYCVLFRVKRLPL